ncbi:cephalosporin hydroxylase [Ensifer sp. 1H6]|nr:cephalosporin hydroxylase [Ensifer sp. 1H6]
MGGHKITMDYEMGGSKRLSGSSDFTMMKSRSFLDKYLENRDEHFRRILEVGVYQGGSFVFLDQLFQPDRMAAIELSDIPIQALETYTSRDAERLKVFWGTSQDDEAAVQTIINDFLGGEIDLVVDDASHFYDQTKATFRVAFPRVRPGGLYIIEDWAWSFQEPYQEQGHPWENVHALANLVVDLMEEMALGPLIQDFEVSPHMIKIRRSAVPASQSIFNTTARRGRTVGLI